MKENDGQVRRNRRTGGVRRWLFSAGAVGLALAPAAHADPGTDSMAYLQLIASRGLIVYDPVGAVNQGMVACSLEDQMTGEETVDQLMRLYPNLTWDQANVIGLSAAQVLCPRNYHPERGATTPRKNRAI